jgi:hypothetical protein
MELLSASIYLETVPSSEPPPASGPLIQGWFFDSLRALNRAFGDDVHDRGGYTLSAVMQDDHGACIRITSLRADLSDFLLDTFLPSVEKKTIVLKTNEQEETRLTANGQIMTSRASFADLRARSSPSASLTVEFTSPTAFRTNSMDLPLPIPYHVLLSWWKAWNKYAPDQERIGYPLHSFAEACVCLASLQQFQTLDAPISRGNHAAGFKGQATFKLQPLEKCADWSAVWESARRDWQMLADFALFSGTGQHTRCGMGQTRGA